MRSGLNLNVKDSKSNINNHWTRKKVKKVKILVDTLLYQYCTVYVLQASGFTICWLYYLALKWRFYSFLNYVQCNRIFIWITFFSNVYE